MTYVTNAERFGFERGVQEGRQEEGLNFVLRLVTRRLGMIAPETEVQIRTLSLDQLEDLGEALLDFSNRSDLEVWLRLRSVNNRESQS